MVQEIKKSKRGAPKKPLNEKGVQIYCYVKREFYLEAHKAVRELLKQYR